MDMSSAHTCTVLSVNKLNHNYVPCHIKWINLLKTWDMTPMDPPIFKFQACECSDFFREFVYISLYKDVYISSFLLNMHSHRVCLIFKILRINVMFDTSPADVYKFDRLEIVHNVLKCDMIKGNESLVENYNFYFLTPLQNASFWS